jgi:hypothetical protein
VADSASTAAALVAPFKRLTRSILFLLRVQDRRAVVDHDAEGRVFLTGAHKELAQLAFSWEVWRACGPPALFFRPAVAAKPPQLAGKEILGRQSLAKPHYGSSIFEQSSRCINVARATPDKNLINT